MSAPSTTTTTAAAKTTEAAAATTTTTKPEEEQASEQEGSKLKVVTGVDSATSGFAAACCGAELVRRAIRTRGCANVIVATGASQFAVLRELVRAEGVAWDKCHFFHLDEYIGIAPTHGASFAKYLKERLVDLLPVAPASFEYVRCCKSPEEAAEECKRLGAAIAEHPIDVAFVGIGENGHLAFNDPPADFETEEPYLVVPLDEDCRKQQLGEGWFPTLADVPTHAISMSIQHIMKSAAIITTVPDERKAKAVAAVVNGPVTNKTPASILQRHPNTFLFLDGPSASLL